MIKKLLLNGRREFENKAIPRITMIFNPVWKIHQVLKVYPKENGVERPQAANTPFQSIDSLANEYYVQENSTQR